MKLIVDLNELNTSVSDWNKFKDLLLKESLNEYKRFFIEQAIKNNPNEQPHIIEDEISRNFFDAYELLGLKSPQRKQEQRQPEPRQPEPRREQVEDAFEEERPQRRQKERSNYLNI